MLENFKEVYKKDRLEEIEFCKNHPKLWIIGMLIFCLIFITFIGIFLYLATYGDILSLIMVGFTTISMICIFMALLNRYVEAFSK